MFSTLAAATVMILIRARLDWKFALKEKRSVSATSRDLGSLRRILNLAQARDWRCRFNSFGAIAVAFSISYKSEQNSRLFYRERNRVPFIDVVEEH